MCNYGEMSEPTNNQKKEDIYRNNYTSSKGVQETMRGLRYTDERCPKTTRRGIFKISSTNNGTKTEH
jgi:hypothetical protein